MVSAKKKKQNKNLWSYDFLRDYSDNCWKAMYIGFAKMQTDMGDKVVGLMSDKKKHHILLHMMGDYVRTVTPSEIKNFEDTIAKYQTSNSPGFRRSMLLFNNIPQKLLQDVNNFFTFHYVQSPNNNLLKATQSMDRKYSVKPPHVIGQRPKKRTISELSDLVSHHSLELAIGRDQFDDLVTSDIAVAAEKAKRKTHKKYSLPGWIKTTRRRNRNLSHLKNGVASTTQEYIDEGRSNSHKYYVNYSYSQGRRSFNLSFFLKDHGLERLMTKEYDVSVFEHKVSDRFGKKTGKSFRVPKPIKKKSNLSWADKIKNSYNILKAVSGGKQENLILQFMRSKISGYGVQTPINFKYKEGHYIVATKRMNMGKLSDFLEKTSKSRQRAILNKINGLVSSFQRIGTYIGSKEYWCDRFDKSFKKYDRYDIAGFNLYFKDVYKTPILGDSLYKSFKKIMGNRLNHHYNSLGAWFSAPNRFFCLGDANSDNILHYETRNPVGSQSEKDKKKKDGKPRPTKKVDVLSAIDPEFAGFWNKYFDSAKFAYDRRHDLSSDESDRLTKDFVLQHFRYEAKRKGIEPSEIRDGNDVNKYASEVVGKRYVARLKRKDQTYWNDELETAKLTRAFRFIIAAGLVYQSAVDKQEVDQNGYVTNVNDRNAIDRNIRRGLRALNTFYLSADKRDKRHYLTFQREMNTKLHDFTGTNDKYDIFN